MQARLLTPRTITIDALRKAAFSSQIIEPFFRPFLGGVFLDHDLETSSRMLDFVFRMFATSDAALPAHGMGARARQIADQLPPDCLRTGASVESLDGTTVRLDSGELLQSEAVVIACESLAAAKLLGESSPPSGQSVTCVYFAADRPPIEEPILVLNGEGEGPINNLFVPSQVSSNYAPADRSLVSVTILGMPDGGIEADVRSQLRQWFGPGVMIQPPNSAGTRDSFGQ